MRVSDPNSIITFSHPTATFDTAPPGLAAPFNSPATDADAPVNPTIQQRKANEEISNLGLSYRVDADLKLYPSVETDLGQMEAQIPATLDDVLEIFGAVLKQTSAEDRISSMENLAEVIQSNLERTSLDDPPAVKGVLNKAGSALTSYSNFLGGRDLGIDDIIGAVNAAQYGDIENSSTLQNSNLASAGAVFSLMLLPTVVKNGTELVDAVKEKNWGEAAGLVANTVAIGCMFASPVLAGLGQDKASAIAAATGNALVIAEHIPEVKEAAEDLFERHFGDAPDADATPFLAAAHAKKLSSAGTELMIGAIHGLVAQGGMLALNLGNIQGGGSNDIAAGIFGSALMATSLFEAASDENVFADFEESRDAVTERLLDPESNGSIEVQGKLALQQEFSQASPDDLQRFSECLKELKGAHSLTISYTDQQEASFAKTLLVAMFPGAEGRDQQIKDAVEKIFEFENHDIDGGQADNANLAKVLDFMQNARLADKSSFTSGRGIGANEFNKQFITAVINIGVLNELSADDLSAMEEGRRSATVWPCRVLEVAD